MEEAKTQENEKLQLALREIELQFKEAKDLLMVKEQEAAEFVAERISSIKEIPVIDTTLLDKLTAENVKLKVHLNLLSGRSFISLSLLIIFLLDK